MISTLGCLAAANCASAATRARSPRAALLVDYAEFNARLGRSLRARGVRVVRCVAPQVWAWRPGRLGTAARSFDRLAVVLPFEEALWREDRLPPDPDRRRASLSTG